MGWMLHTKERPYHRITTFHSILTPTLFYFTCFTVKEKPVFFKIMPVEGTPKNFQSTFILLG